MNIKTIKQVLKSDYGLKVNQVSVLEGYDSVNYKIKTGSKTFVLKQHQYSKETTALLEAENHIFEQLNEVKAYDFPRTIQSIDNRNVVKNDDQIFRLLTFVEGEFLGDIDHTPSLLNSFGVFLAKMDHRIHKCYQADIISKKALWDLQHFKLNYKLLNYITNPRDRSLVDYFFLQFDQHVYPKTDQLRKGIIHNDANDWNVLSKNGKISGIIDFGDMCHSWLINEVAIAITYIMMKKEEPLKAASNVIQGYHSIIPLEKQELDILYYLVAARLCTSVCNSAYTKTIRPDSEYITISEKPAWNLLRKWISINPIKAKDSFRKAAEFSPTNKKNHLEELQKRNKNISQVLSLSYDQPIYMNQSAFQYMYDTEGNTFLDAYNNIMLVGHCHPKVVRAGQKTMARLNTNTRYLYDELIAYSESLLARFPNQLNKVFFVNSGSAASDLAIRMAMTHTNKKRIMTLEHGYHGNTKVGIDISHYKYRQGGSGKQDYIITTPMPKAFESGYADNGNAGEYFGKKTKHQIKRNSDEIAAFIAEPIVGCGGQVPLAHGYLNKVYSAIREQGGVCISDEVQVGFGRLGDYFWGYEMYDVVPDMVIIGKPMGNGHPIGAVITTSEIASSFNNGMEFFSSFGGNPVSCAIGNSILNVIADEELQQQAKKVGDYLITQLKQLQFQFDEIADVRGSGLFIGVEIYNMQGQPNTELAQKIKNGLREQFILIGTDGPFDNVLKIKPPLYFNERDAEILVHAITQILVDSKKKL